MAVSLVAFFCRTRTTETAFVSVELCLHTASAFQVSFVASLHTLHSTIQNLVLSFGLILKPEVIPLSDRTLSWLHSTPLHLCSLSAFIPVTASLADPSEVVQETQGMCNAERFIVGHDMSLLTQRFRPSGMAIGELCIPGLLLLGFMCPMCRLHSADVDPVCFGTCFPGPRPPQKSVHLANIEGVTAQIYDTDPGSILIVWLYHVSLALQLRDAQSKHVLPSQEQDPSAEHQDQRVCAVSAERGLLCTLAMTGGCRYMNFATKVFVFGMVGTA